MKQRVKHWWLKTPLVIRKPLVLTLGIIVVVLGIILLPLPGPGWAVIFIGFAILATEFEPAERVRDFLINALKWLIDFGLQLLRAPWKNPFQP